MWIVYLRL